MAKFDWDDLRVFLAIKRQGSLSAAARELKVSQPTVGRRISQLESNLSARLFDRLPDGFAPTAAGLELVGLAEQMELAANSVVRKQPSFADRIQGTVRISVFEQTTQFLTDHIGALQQALPEVEIEISVTHLAANLSRREADLLIRECLPDSPGLVAKKLGQLGHAIYGSKLYVESNPAALTEERYQQCAWIGPDDEHLYFAGQKWLREKLSPRLPALRCNNGLVFYDAVRKHAGLAILPCFVGDKDESLTRLSEPLDSAISSHYMLVHQDLRRVPLVRAVMNVLIDLYQKHEDVLLGRLG